MELTKTVRLTCDGEEAGTTELKAFLPDTAAGRLAFVADLMAPIDEEGKPLTPILTPEQGRRLLELAGDGKNSGQ